MDTKHTPGPWRTNTAGCAKRGEPFRITEIYVYAPDTQDDTAICAEVIDPITQEPSEANANLIASAPELLSALIVLRERHQIDAPHHADLCEFCKLADAAIAKATKGAA